ncbi:MAG: YtxH domain-containing protein [Enterococcus sp.]
MNNFGKGLLFGAVVGTAFGLLKAPNSGKETRQRLRQDVDDITESTLEFNDSLTNLKEAIVTTKTTAATLIPSVQAEIKKDLTAYQFQIEPRRKQIEEQLEVLNSHVEKLSQLGENFTPTEEK